LVAREGRVPHLQSGSTDCTLVARGGWLLEREEYRTCSTDCTLVAREAWLLEREEHRTVRVDHAHPFSKPNHCLSCFDAIYDGNGKRSGQPERNAIGHTHGSASSGAKA
jgi:hypothetical protein